MANVRFPPIADIHHLRYLGRMIGDFQLERDLGRRVFLQEKRGNARFWELMLYGLALFSIFAMLLAWFIPGFRGVTGA